MALNKKIFNNNALRIIIVAIIGIFICTGYMTGSDWRGYELSFYNNDIIREYQKEPGLYILMFLCRSIGIDFWPMWIVIKAICYCFTIVLLKRYTKGNYAWPFFFFVGYFALFYYIDNPMRNLIAASIFLSFGVPCIENKDWKKYIIVVAISSLFHLSTLLVAPAFLLSPKKSISFKTALITIISLVAVVLLVGPSSLISSLNVSLWYFELYQDRLYNYTTQETASYGISLGLVFLIILFLYSLFLKEKNGTSDESLPLMYNLAFYFIITIIVGSVLVILFRASMFLFLPYLVSVSTVFNNYRHKSILSPFVKMGVFIFLFYVFTNALTKDFRYVPYSSYIEYAFAEKPSFFERSKYNFENTPYDDNN